jgi:hypothetical protein
MPFGVSIVRTRDDQSPPISLSATSAMRCGQAPEFTRHTKALRRFAALLFAVSFCLGGPALANSPRLPSNWQREHEAIDIMAGITAIKRMLRVARLASNLGLRQFARFAGLRARISMDMVLVLAIAYPLLHPIEVSAQAQRRVTTNRGIPFDEIIEVRVRGALLKIPAGYLWPELVARGRVNEKAEMGFSFWMPDRRYLEAQPSPSGFRPVEPGRDYPRSSTYVVSVNSLHPVLQDDAGYISPERKFKNFTSIKGNESLSFEEESFGLVRFWRRDWPHPRPEPFTNYRHAEGTDPQILFRCTPPHQLRYTSKPNCVGDVYYAQDSLGFFVYFPREEISHWREIVASVRDLFNAWKSVH